MIAAMLVLGLAVAGDGVDAKRLFEIGSQAYEQGNYRTAISAFEAAHTMTPRPVTAFSAAQAYRLQYLGDDDARKLNRAVSLYRAYLDLAPDGNRREVALQHLKTLEPMLESIKRARGAAAIAPPAAAGTQVIVSSSTPEARVRIDGGAEESAPASFDVAPGKHRIEVSAPLFIAQALETMAVDGKAVAFHVTLEPRPAAVALRAPAGSRLFVDGKLIGTAPLPGAVEVPAGHHAVAGLVNGMRPFTREFDLARGQSIDVNVSFERSPQRWLATAALISGAVVLAGSGVTWGLALREQLKLDHATSTLIGAGATDAERKTALENYNEAAIQLDVFVQAGVATAIVGGVVAATGLVLWVADRAEVPAPAITPIIAPNTAGVSVAGHF